jgi:hypothetical protein
MIFSIEAPFRKAKPIPSATIHYPRGAVPRFSPIRLYYTGYPAQGAAKQPTLYIPRLAKQPYLYVQLSRSADSYISHIHSRFLNLSCDAFTTAHRLEPQDHTQISYQSRTTKREWLSKFDDMQSTCCRTGCFPKMDQVLPSSTIKRW